MQLCFSGRDVSFFLSIHEFSRFLLLLRDECLFYVDFSQSFSMLKYLDFSTNFVTNVRVYQFYTYLHHYPTYARIYVYVYLHVRVRTHIHMHMHMHMLPKQSPINILYSLEYKPMGWHACFKQRLDFHFWKTGSPWAYRKWAAKKRKSSPNIHT